MVWENAAIDNTVKGQCIYHFRNSRMLKYWKFYFIKIHYGFLFKNHGDDFFKLINLCSNCKLLAVINMIFKCPIHLTCLLRNPYAGQEATFKTRYGTMDWFKIGKEIHQGCKLSLCLFNLHAEYIIQNAGLDDSQAVIKVAGEISATSDMQIITAYFYWQKVKRN